MCIETVVEVASLFVEHVLIITSISSFHLSNMLKSHPHYHTYAHHIFLSQAEEVTEPEVTEAQKSFFGKVKDRLTTTATPDKEDVPAKQSPPPPKKETKAAAPPATPVVTAQVAKATKTSDKVLKATEVAKDEVKKKGVQETKEKMSSKSSAVAADDSSTPEPVEEEEEAKEVEEVKVEEKGTKRKLVKGVTMIVAAGAVAVARNVVTAWLGRGML